MIHHHLEPQQAESAQTSARNRRIPSTNLFGPDRVVEIEHKGEIYSLRITRQDKLILTK